MTSNGMCPYFLRSIKSLTLPLLSVPVVNPWSSLSSARPLFVSGHGRSLCQHWLSSRRSCSFSSSSLVRTVSSRIPRKISSSSGYSSLSGSSVCASRVTLSMYPFEKKCVCSGENYHSKHAGKTCHSHLVAIFGPSPQHQCGLFSARALFSRWCANQRRYQTHQIQDF